jgi:hypothetical protein
MSDIRFTNFVFTVGINAQSVEVLPYNPNRKYLLIQNQSLINIFLGFDNKGGTSDGIMIGPTPNGYYELNNVVTSSSINIIAPLRAKIIIVEGI